MVLQVTEHFAAAEVERSLTGPNMVVRGLALPFDTPDERPGLVVDGNELVAHQGTVFASSFLDQQLSEPDPLARVLYTYQHTDMMGLAGFPIGRVLSLEKTPRGIQFTALIDTEDSLGATVAHHLRAGNLKGEVSTMVTIDSAETFRGGGGRVFRRALSGRLWEISQVLWAQFSDARLIGFCQRGSCHMRYAAVGSHETDKAPESASWSAPTLSDFTDQSWEDLSAAEQRRISQHYAGARGSIPPDSFGDLLLPHHLPSRSGVGPVVWRGVANAMARLNQTDADAATREGMWRHLAAHYRQFDREPPPMNRRTDEHEVEQEVRLRLLERSLQ